MSYCKTNDTNIYYEYIPAANPNAATVVLAHGLGLDSTTWNLLIPYLQDFHLLTFDFRDHGRTISTSSEINWDILYKDFKNLLHFLGITHYHYVGHGLGGLFGVELFSTFGEKAASFVLLSTPCYYPKNVAQKAIQFREKIFSSAHPEDFIDFMISQILYDQTEEKYQLIKNAYLRSNRTKYMDWLKLLSQSLSLDKLSKITVPTLVLIGEFDINYPPSLIAISTNYFPQCRTYIIPEASNVIFIDQPELVSEHLKQFFLRKQKFANRPEIRSILPYLEELDKNLYDYDHSSHLTIDFLYRFNITYNEKKIEGQWNRRKAKEIMSYLAIYKKVSREKLIEVFWPDVPLPKAQNQLRVSLNHLRKTLGDYAFILEITPQSVQIAENYRCDVTMFQQKLYEYQMTENKHARLLIATELLSNWNGNILEDFYDNWAVELKRKLENSFFSLLEDAHELSIQLNESVIASQIENVLKEDIDEIIDIKTS